MKEKVLKTLLVIFAIMSLTLSNFLILGTNIAEAVYEELENQTTSLNSSIDYDAYFKVGDTKVHSATASINQGTSLYININVKDTGVALDGGKIKLENANFKLGEVKNDFVKNVNYEAKEIELNQIVYGNNIGIELPITFEKSESIDVGYFDAQNTITLSGTYKKNTSEKSISGNIKTALMWTEEAEINISQDIEKYMSLGENGVLLQDKLTVSVINNVLPKQNEKITVNVPQIASNKPEQAIVLKNGEKLTESVNYSKKAGTLIIETNNKPNEENKVLWNNGVDEYKIIYTYSEEVGEEAQQITLDATVESKLYAKENAISKKDTQNINISKMGNIASIEQYITESQYKGYMYANVDNETIYDETSVIEISNAQVLNKIEFNTVADNYLDENGTQYNTQNATYFKQTAINKDEMLRILGQDGTITIYKNENELVETFNKDTQIDENGNLVVTYDENNISKIKIVTTKPLQEGKLNIHNQKAIKGKTGYTKEQLKLVTGLESNVQVTGIDTATAKAVMELKDAITEAEINLSTNNLSTLQENSNVTISIDLKTNSNKYDLYKNPTIKIKLPNDVESFKLNSAIQKLYGDEFTIESAKYNPNTKEINLVFTGEQTTFGNLVNQGMHIVMDANVTLNKLAPTKQDNIVMTYTNENGNEGSYEKTVGVNIASKDGVLTYSNISGYNEAGDTTETLSQDIVNGKLDEGKSAKVATANMAIVNNYSTEISDVVIIGKIPGKEERQINNSKVTSTFITSLAEGVTTSNEGAKIYYSEDINAQEDSKMWEETVESFENVRAYKIVLNQNKIGASEIVKFGYKFNIPENLGENQSTYTDYELSYTYAGQRVTTNSTIALATKKAQAESLDNGIMLMSAEGDDTENLEGQTVEIAEGVTANIVATSGGKELKDSDEVYEGQTVKYTVTITNNSGSDINNLQMTAEHSNAIFYGEELVETITSELDENSNRIVKELAYMALTEGKEKSISEEVIKNGEEYICTYEIQVAKITESNAQISGNMKIKADNIEEHMIETINNTIKDGKIAISLLKTQYIDYPFEVEGKQALHLIVKNISEDVINNQKVIMPLNNTIEIARVYQYDDEHNEKDIDYTVENDQLILNFEELNAEDKEQVEIEIKIKEFANGTMNLNLKSYSDIDSIRYYSNEINEKVNYYQSDLEVEQIIDNTNNTLNNGDRFRVRLNVTNKSDNNDYISVMGNLPRELTIISGQKTIDGVTEQIKISQDNDFMDIGNSIDSKQTITLEFEFEVNIKLSTQEQIELNFIISGTNKRYYTDMISYQLNNENNNDKEEIEEVLDDNETIEDTNNEENNNGDNNDDSNNGGSIDNDNNNGNTDSNNNYVISGNTWIDTNKNGINNNEERPLANLTVYLLNADTGNIVKDSNNANISTSITSNGTYRFENLTNGKYLVAFEYDTDKYRLTTYKRDGIDESMNSDVISKVITLDNSQKTFAITDVLEIKNNSLNNIDAGFIEKEKFDLRLDKYVSRVTVQNNVGTTVNQYRDTQLAKVEIKSKNLVNSLVLIEYTINITNEGELDGYVGEILDYIPNDLKFSSEINKDWYVSTDGILHNITIANEKLEIGQAKTVKLILTKTMTENNTGLIINSAEIGKAGNELNISDIDSTPANKVDGEDDMSKAEVIVSVSTGKEIFIAVSTILTILIITGIAIFIIRKRKGGEDEEDN